jgi:predicted hydrocarbon binding protein
MTESVVSFHPDIFIVFLNHLHETYGSAGDSILFQMSKEFSKQGMALIGKQLGVDKEKNYPKIIEAFSERMRIHGWGEFTVIGADYDALEFSIQVSNIPFKEIYNGVSCMHYFYRGALAGFFEYMLEQPMMAKQHKTVKNESIIFYITKQY